MDRIEIYWERTKILKKQLKTGRCALLSGRCQSYQ